MQPRHLPPKTMMRKQLRKKKRGGVEVEEGGSVSQYGLRDAKPQRTW